MLSLPEDWNYKISGLSQINKEGIDSIRTALIELEKAGYIERRRCRDAKGRLRVSEYIIREKPIEQNWKTQHWRILCRIALYRISPCY